MKQYYSNFFYDEPIIYQSAGQHTDKYRIFGEDYQRVLIDVKNPILPEDPTRNTRTYDIRQWELWAVLNNAELEQHHKVLEYGAWPTFYCVYVSYLVREIVVIDNLQAFNRNDGVYFAALHKMFPDVWISEINKYNRPNLKMLIKDIQCIDFEDKSFDRIISYGVHEHIRDDLQGLKEICRILKDDGLVSISVDFFHHGWPYHDLLQGRCYDPVTLINLVEKAGFVFVHLPDWSRYDAQKDRINTVQNPEVMALAITLRKKNI